MLIRMEGKGKMPRKSVHRTVEEMIEHRRSLPSQQMNNRKLQPSYTRKYRDGKVVDHTKREFISWDGEGADIDGVHTYILLKNNLGKELIMEKGISTQVALEFLCRSRLERPDAINVIYGGSYDVNMILGDLSYKYIKLLQKNNRVFWRNFNIQYIPRKYFMVSMYSRKEVGDKRKRKPLVTFTLWDVIGFFQGTFVKSLKEYFPDELYQDHILHIPEIEKGKERRGEFTTQELHDFIIPYCQYEVSALTMLMEQLRENFREAGITLSRWDGAGAAAAAVLKKYGVKKFYPQPSQDVNMLTKEKQLEEAGQRAYGGGHVEMYMYGHTEEVVHHYDIIGAYPSEMPGLPNLSNGEWIFLNDLSNHNVYKYPFSLYKIYWDFRDSATSIFPFFYRKPYSEARIFYPEQGYGWVYSPELVVALEHRHILKGELRLLECWQFIPHDDIKPFAFVYDLYQKRLEYKRKLMGAALALKLAVNSFYGKMAQTVGYTSEEGMRRPPFFNIHLAGMVTSGIRAKMMKAMLQAPDKIIAVATDGLWSLVPLDVKIGKGLGDWEYEKLSSFTSIQAGVYFGKKQEGHEEIYHYRGFNQGSISEEQVLDGWRNRAYALPVKTRRFVTMGSAVASEDRFHKYWRTWQEDDRLLELYAGGRQKRMADVLEDGRHDENASIMLLPTLSNPVPTFQNYVDSFDDVTEDMLSRKHPLPWDVTEEQTEKSRKIALDEAIQWEITESEL